MYISVICKLFAVSGLSVHDSRVAAPWSTFVNSNQQHNRSGGAVAGPGSSQAVAAGTCCCWLLPRNKLVSPGLSSRALLSPQRPH